MRQYESNPSTLSALPALPVLSGFLGIDWSGAKGARHAGLQLAMARPGTAAPHSLTPPRATNWSRLDVLDLLLGLADDTADAAMLVGIDFAFAHPFVDVGAYYPGLANAPATPAALWAHAEAINAAEPHLYGGAMFGHAVWGDFYLAPPHYAASRYQSRRRITELAARTAGRSPSPTFKAVGADNVSTGSLAGMRLLHHLKQTLADRLAVWPFDPIVPGQTKLILVEIFPSFYFYRLGMVPARRAAAHVAFLNHALAAYDSAGLAADFVPAGKDADEADAIIAAAALRYFAGANGFALPPSHEPAMRQEGWIFGVPD